MVVDANSLHVDVSVGVDAHHFLTMLLLFYSDANVGIDAIGFERVYLERGGWGGSGWFSPPYHAYVKTLS